MLIKVTKQIMALADEMYERKARCGRDYPPSWKPRTREKMQAAGLVECKFKCPIEGPQYYFTEAGLAWYLRLRPELPIEG